MDTRLLAPCAAARVYCVLPQAQGQSVHGPSEPEEGK